jgi:hypothetical protein
LKTILVISLLTSITLLLIILMDLGLKFPLNGLLWKELKPFRVTEATHYVILGIFVSYFVLKSGVKYFQKKKQKINENSPS